MSTDKKHSSDSHNSLIKSTSILSLGTMSSRFLGFFRDVILANMLGTGFRADAFFIAFKIPNLFRDFVGEGASNAAVVPVLVECKENQSKEELFKLINVVFTWAMIILSVLTLLGILTSPLLVRALAPGFIVDPQKLLFTVHLTKIMFPYLIFIGLTAYSMGILYTFRSFTIPAFSPCLLNISMIISALIASRWMQEPVFGLAIGVLAGGVLQLIFQFKGLKKIGYRYQKPKSLNHSEARKIGKLVVPRMFGSGVYQLTVLIDTVCASLAFIVGAGGISAIYYANRIIQLPMGIFSVALASAVLPSLSGLANRKDTLAIKKMIVFSLENIFFVMCPITIALFLLSEPIIRVLFERGNFGTYSTDITSFAVSFYALGLFSFGGIKILVSAFHAMQDTKTPVKVAAFCLTINALLNIILMGPMKVGGIALASSIAGTVDFLILFYVMDKKLDHFDSKLLKYFLKVTIVSVCMGVGCFFLWRYLPFSNELLKLCVVGGIGVLVYGFLCLVFKIDQAQKVWRMIKEMKM